MDKHFQKQTILGKNKRTNISKKSKRSFEKSSFKNGWTNISKKKKQMQFGEKRTDKHFQKQQNAVWRKKEWANILKKRQN